MEKNRQAIKLKVIIVSCMMAFFAVVVAAVISTISLGKVRRQDANYNELIASLKAEQISYEKAIEEKSNPNYLEEQWHNQYGMIKDGDTMFIFEK